MFARLLLGSLRARRGRMALGLLAVTLGVGIAIALATLALQVGDDVARTLRAAGPNFLLQPRGADWSSDLGAEVEVPRAGATLPEESLRLIKDSFWRHNLLEAAPELRAPLTLRGVAVPAVGTWFARAVATNDEPWTTGLAGLHPTWQLLGRWPAAGAAELAIGQDLASRFGLAPDDTVTVGTPLGARLFRVSGVVHAGGAEDAQAWMDLGLAQEITGQPGRIERVWVSALVRPGPETAPPDPAVDPEGYERHMCTAYPGVVAEALAGAVPGAEALPATERIAGEAHIVGRLTLLLVLLALAALAASTLGLLSTTTATVVERSTELALLRSIGASPRQLAVLLLGETTLVSLAGGLLGWVAGSLAAVVWRSGFAGATAFQPLLIPVALALALAVGGAGTIVPLRVALGLDPARVLRGS